MTQTIFPILRYDDARAAIEFLCSAFGFIEVFSVPPEGDYVRHAQLRLGTNLIMLGSIRDDDGLTSPKIAGTATQGLSVYVDDVDAHFKTADQAGAVITVTPVDTEFGSREYHARDPEGHHWVFSNYMPNNE